MRYFILLLSLITISQFGFSQNNDRQEEYIVRLTDESVIDFINRIKPDSIQLAHPLIETNVLGASYKSIIALYCSDDHRDMNIGCNEIFGHLYIPMSIKKYRNVKFGPIKEDGGYPEILAISFANADNDNLKELLVLSRYRVYNVDESGYFYKTFIYDNPDDKSELLFLEHLEKEFLGCDCYSRDGSDTNSKAKYKTIKSVKQRLKELGYR